MTEINIYCYVVFILLSITVQVKSQICKNAAQYDRCSTNSACGCFSRVGTNGDSGVCGFLWPTCSSLVPCNTSDNSCAQSNTVCVQHPRCHDLPLCYPVTMSKQNICPPTINKINSKWKQHGITVAGGNQYGDQSNQLNTPTGIYIDDNEAILIADTGNNRIVEWKYNSNSGENIAGSNDDGDRPDRLFMPTDVTVDKQKNAIIICDSENARVMRWFRQSQTNPQILISHIACGGVALDKDGSLYVSDKKRSEVKRWKQGDIDGTLVAGGSGEGNLPNQLQGPSKIFVDADYSIYVADTNNHRITKWKKDAKEGIIVAGGNGQGDSLNQLFHPQGLIVDKLGQIFIADTVNHRVMRWYEEDTNGSIVVGGNGKGKEPNQLHYPQDLSFDVQGNLYVADSANHRIQKYELYIE
ncbi:unnamed protein product [Adineta steineri]|uniref:NHL repeat containing protein n=1 Tax=Adineta steineri TaxID=433720 RepID=A0A813Q5W2_9BILA|nr:unnamed protein product [Adineta steineri]CAF1464989.1 unnamed protein product [Adineta steineri]CAF1468289.1 unnamed protein product [Adineta steineri]